MSPGYIREEMWICLVEALEILHGLSEFGVLIPWFGTGLGRIGSDGEFNFPPCVIVSIGCHVAPEGIEHFLEDVVLLVLC